MKQKNITYLFFYISFFVVILVAAFFDKSWLVYFKPLIPISLIVLYIGSVKNINFVFPLCMLALIGANIFVSMDFVEYYNFIAFFISIHYLLCALLSRKFISEHDIRFSKLTSLPILISIVLIVYLTFAIAELALPRIRDSIALVAIVLTTMVLFVVISFFVYLANRYEKVIFLFIAACCALFVNGLLGINELYYYNRVFTVLINIAEAMGVYFFTRFFIETKPINNKFLKEKYF